MAKVFTITVPPKLGNKRRERTTDPRYVDGQRLLVEAMKTFNDIVAPHAGKVVSILVADGAPVEYDQPLMIIE